MKIQKKDDMKFHEQVKFMDSPKWDLGDVVLDPLQLAVMAVRNAVRRGEPLEKALKVNGLTEDVYHANLSHLPIDEMGQK